MLSDRWQHYSFYLGDTVSQQLLSAAIFDLLGVSAPEDIALRQDMYSHNLFFQGCHICGKSCSETCLPTWKVSTPEAITGEYFQTDHISESDWFLNLFYVLDNPLGFGYWTLSLS
jgi:hypothetical protein